MFKFMNGWFPVWRAVFAILRQRVAEAELSLKVRKALLQQQHDEKVADLADRLEVEKDMALRAEVASIFKGV